MGLIDVLARSAASRAHVLVAEAPGAFRERVALERAIVRMGWCRAQSVADADVLAVVGEPGDDLAAVLDHVWSQMSEPRVRVHVRHEAEVAGLLARARDQLVDGSGGRPAKVRAGFTPSAEAMAHGDDHGGDGGHDHGGDGGHDHDAMMPDGIPLAEGAADRDGLEMDELHLPLGPVLAHWPAGLVLTVTLHGDVVVDAGVEQLASIADPRPDDPVVRAARLLDAAGSVLALAGLPAESARAVALRDRCLDGDLGGDLGGGSEVTALGDRIVRRRALRWVLGGLSIEGSHGGTETLHDRLVGLFADARAELEGEATSRVGPGVAALPGLVSGLELATLRLWLAALAPDLVAHEAREVGHG